MKTIKQIADELGVDKQRVYRYIRKHRISEAHHEAGVMWYSDTVETQIKQHFSGNDRISDVHHEAHHTTSNDTVIDTVISMLQRELDTKNKLLDEQQRTITELTAALRESQSTTKAEQLLHADTKKLLPRAGDPGEPSAADQPGAVTKKSWWPPWKKKDGDDYIRFD